MAGRAQAFLPQVVGALGVRARFGECWLRRRWFLMPQGGAPCYGAAAVGGPWPAPLATGP
eukprot:8633708-Lingulodinium_polyedra.AAC.1